MALQAPYTTCNTLLAFDSQQRCVCRLAIALPLPTASKARRRQFSSPSESLTRRAQTFHEKGQIACGMELTVWF